MCIIVVGYKSFHLTLYKLTAIGPGGLGIQIDDDYDVMQLKDHDVIVMKLQNDLHVDPVYELNSSDDTQTGVVIVDDPKEFEGKTLLGFGAVSTLCNFLHLN